MTVKGLNYWYVWGIVCGSNCVKPGVLDKVGMLCGHSLGYIHL